MPKPSENIERDAQVAAQIEADVAVERIADVYAQALFAAAEDDTALLDEFDSLIEEVIDRYPKFDEILVSGLISTEEKRSIIDRVFGGRCSKVMINFLKVVASHGRLDCLAAIHARLHLLYEKQHGRIRVEITTATPIDEAQLQMIGANLQKLIGGEPILTARVDPNVIGGAVVRVGDTVYDGSIANKLEIIRQQMIDRSAHEIQSRRDRFRNPEGN